MIQTSVRVHSTGWYTKVSMIWYMYTSEYIAVYTKNQIWARARAQRYVRLHHNSSYTRVSKIFYMYTCEYVDVYKEVLSVSTRRDEWICKFAQHRFIYNSIYDMILCTLLNILMYTKRIKVWALTRAQTYVSSHNLGWYTRGSIIWYMYTCEYLWILVNTCEYLWICVNTCEYLWILVNTCEHLWICMHTKRF